MSNLVQLANGTKAYGTKTLFGDVSFSINDEEHVGVIGPNGAGKSTLFKILIGEESLDRGELVKRRGIKIGYLAQHDDWSENLTLEQYLSDCSKPIWELKALSEGLGLSEDYFYSPISTLSGGYRMRCKLLHLLGEEPDLLLLDEPTNYLDLESLLVLERFLQGFASAFLLISHDREFLRRTTDHILEIEGGDIVKFHGSLDDYFEQKNLLRTQLEARAMSLQEKRKEILGFVARFGAKASKAKQAQSRLKSLAKLESIEIKSLPDTPTITLPKPLRAGKRVLFVEDADLGYPDKVVLKGVHFSLTRGDHLAVVGVNGAGKTTFLRSIAGDLEPRKGNVNYGHEVSIGYYAQHVAESLDSDHSVFESLSGKAHPSVMRQEILNLAGALLFSGADIEKKISVLSGGERSRVALGRILLQKAPCLVMDEPTNHLDFQTVEALTNALTQFEGTVVVVSHDRSFVSRIGTKILQIREGQASLFHGTYDEYVWSVQKGSFSRKESSAPVRKEKKASVEKTPNERRNSIKRIEALKKNLQKIEKKTIKIQNRMTELNALLSSDHEHPETHKRIRELADLQEELSENEEEWLRLSSEKEALEEKWLDK